MYNAHTKQMLTALGHAREKHIVVNWRKIVVMIIFVGMTAALFGCAHQDEWTKTDTYMQAVVTAAYAADAYTTSKIQYHPELREEGPAHFALGRQPSTSDTWMYFGTLAITNYFISRALPAKWRPFWQSVNIVAHGSAAFTNCQLGAGCKGNHHGKGNNHGKGKGND